MKRIFFILKWFLIAWGGLSLIGLVALIGFTVCQFGSFGPIGRNRVDSASTQDVRFILNWCRLGEERIEKVVRSYVSARSFTGDHLDAYAIKISHVNLEELEAKKDDIRGWYRCDCLPPIVHDAVDFAGDWLGGNEISWFPKEDELRSDQTYVYPISIYCHGVWPSAVQLIFIRPADKMIFYFDAKT